MTISTGQATRVFIVAEVRAYCEALADALRRDRRFEVVGFAAGIKESHAVLEGGGAEVVLVDASGSGGADVVRAVAAAAPPVRVVAIGVPGIERDVVALAEAGAAGYLERGGSISELLEVLDGVARGEVQCSPEITATLFRRVGSLARERRLEPLEETLTGRELDVLRLIEAGRSNKEIAVELSIEVPTVKNHVHAILGKLDVHRRAEAAAVAREQRLPEAHPRAEN